MLVVEKQLRQCVESKGQSLPGDFYQLLDCQRFHPNRNELIKAIRAANRFLHHFQNHDDKDVVQRARSLQMMVAEAEDVFSDPQRWSVYDEMLIQELRIEWDRRTPGSWHREDLRRWLLTVQLVDPQRLDGLLEVFSTSVSVASPAGRSEQPSTGTPGKFWERAFPAAKKKPISQKASPAPQSSVHDAQHSNDAATSSRTVAQDSRKGKTVGPPPVSGRRLPPARRGREAKPVSAASQSAPTSRQADRSTIAAFHAERSERSVGVGFLWIFGSAIATVMVLGIVALIIFVIVTLGR
jgi:hypothetical protein